jgi:hypothetical protein
MKLVLILLLCTINGDCFSQNLYWHKTENWKLYDVHDQKAFLYSLDTLRNFKSIGLDKDKMQMFLQNVTIIQKDNEPVWMGFYLATCKLQDGTTVKIDISMYGGFFYDEKSRTYYQLPSNLKDDWFNYLTEQGTVLQSRN